MSHLSRPQTDEMLTILSSYFKVKKPKLLYRTRMGHAGTYRVSQQRISTDGWEPTVIHEFAHHLDAVTNKRRVTRSNFNPRVIIRTTFHDVPFRACLLKVAAAWYGDHMKYPWHGEYKAVFKWYAQTYCKSVCPSGAAGKGEANEKGDC